ncbi:neurogenic locus notch homolog protein 1-like isoform X3 [Neodiprion lecontei]|uniref:Neurogenic locus notch homolog protein 1-like isoform X3 n=1 Tax=Neodiprion lecontei TaxID=441921 RepID=A0A6J0CBA8_NEOLC|nr:neurogenic locus notch homolog protein 1-like isoform X3 [Neodiprion lecontei]
MTDIVIIWVIAVFAAFSTANSNNPQSFHPPSRSKKESMKGFYNLSQRVTYPEKIWRGGEETFIHNGYRGDPETRSLTKRSEVVNCSVGYTRDSIYNNCILPCSKINCINGKCDGRTECKCNDGYVKSQTNSFICHPKCRPCLYWECTKSQLCTCDKGYRLSSNQQTCEPICNDPHCYGKPCVKPDRCYRDSTYYKFVYGQYCSRECGFGECVGLDTCECFRGYNKTKDGQCFDPICNKRCGFGECVGPNTCKCFRGYNKTKDGRCFDPICNEGCGYGKCVGPNTCKCLNGCNKTKDGQCTYPICKEECKYSSCTGPDICTCHPGYEKPFENSTTCVPRCTRCDNGICVGPEICRCHSGFVNPKSNKGTCAHNCSRGWTGESCEEPIMCVIALYTPHDSENSIREISESNCIDDETTNFQVDTELPRCHEKCFNELTIRSIANFTRSTANMTYYFVPITSACNEMRPSDTDWSQKSTTITVLILIPIILFATIFGFVTFVRRRRRNGGFNDAMPVYDDAGEVRLYEPLKRRFCSIFQLFL